MRALARSRPAQELAALSKHPQGSRPPVTATVLYDQPLAARRPGGCFIAIGATSPGLPL